MSLLKSLLQSLAGVYLIVAAVAVTVNFIAQPIYDPEIEGLGRTTWQIINPAMVAAAVVAIIAALPRKLKADAAADAGQWEYFNANFSYFATVAMSLTLLWNWVDTQWGHGGHGMMWVIINVAFVLLMSSIGSRLLRELEDHSS